MAQVKEVAEGVRIAMKDAGITDPQDVHFVQIKCPLLTADRIEDARVRGQTVAVHDTYKSMAYSEGHPPSASRWPSVKCQKMR